MPSSPVVPQNKKLSPEAQRALQEAEARRAEQAKLDRAQSKSDAGEIGGPSGPEPTRYGDWEKKGLTSDF